MKMNKFIIFTVIAAGIVGVSSSLTLKSNIIEHAQAAISTDPSSLQSIEKAKSQIDGIPVIKNKGLKTNANYISLEGQISTKLEQTGEVSLTDITVEQPGRFHVKYTHDTKTPSLFEEAVNDGEKVQIKDNAGKINDFAAPAKSVEKIDNVNNTSPDYNGTYLPIGGVNELLHPEMFIIDLFSKGQFTVKGEENYLDRDTTVIVLNRSEGKLGNKLTFWFDNETGIILKMVSSDGDKPLQTIAFEKVNFNSKAKEDSFKLLK